MKHADIKRSRAACLWVGLLPGLLGGCGLLNAEAGEDQTVVPGQTVALTAQATFPLSSSSIGYIWTQVRGQRVELLGTQSPLATFVAPEVPSTTELVFELTVTSKIGTTPVFSTDRLKIVVDPDADPASNPLVNAGVDVSVKGGETVQLRGSTTLQNEDDLAFEWQQIGGAAVGLDGPPAKNTTFVAPHAASSTELTFEFVVTPPEGSPFSDIVVVTVEPAQPIADAGPDLSAFAGGSVTLDASASNHPGGGSLVFLWAQLIGPTVTLSNAVPSKGTFVAPEVAEPTLLRFEVTVLSDPQLTTASDTVDITVAPYPDPVADAGGDRVVAQGELVVLDGSGSADPAGAALTLEWSAPPELELSDDDSSQVVFTAPEVSAPTAFDITLTVTNVRGQEQTTTVVVTVTPL